MLLTTVDPIMVTEYSVVFSAVALPLTYFPILVVANDPDYMGEPRRTAGSRTRLGCSTSSRAGRGARRHPVDDRDEGWGMHELSERPRRRSGRRTRPRVAGRRYDAALHLLDRQLVDPDGRLVGKVDDVELAEGADGVLVPTGLMVGMAALLPRLGDRSGPWLYRHWVRLAPRTRSAVGRAWSTSGWSRT